MKLGNLAGRAVLLDDTTALDVHDATDGRFGPTLHAIYEEWESFVEAAAALDTSSGARFDPAHLSSPVPEPRQVFAVGLNYRSHAEESGMELPAVPAVFTKYPASLSGPFDPVQRSTDTLDWEVELVVVIGRRADSISVSSAWGHVAGLAVGQDFSDRTLQFAAARQFSLGKSRRGFGPIGPWLVTTDELEDPDDLALSCSINGEIVQEDRTSGLVFSVPELVAQLSEILPLLPGDVIFTGTPAGVGQSRTPPRFLDVDDVVESWIEGIGTIRNRVIP